MGYSSNDSMVRADRFKPSGKWYDTIALDMGRFYGEPLIHEAVHKALAQHQRDHEGSPRAERHAFIVVLDPAHPHAHPVVAWGREDGTWGYSDLVGRPARVRPARPAEAGAGEPAGARPRAAPDASRRTRPRR